MADLTAEDIDALEDARSDVIALASSYTRGRGFERGPAALPADLRAVVHAASVRMLWHVRHPAGVRSESMGPFAVQYDTAGFGWTVAEKCVLDRYRVRAQ